MMLMFFFKKGFLFKLLCGVKVIPHCEMYHRTKRHLAIEQPSAGVAGTSPDMEAITCI